MSHKHPRLDREQVTQLMENSASRTRRIPMPTFFKQTELVCRQYLDLLEVVEKHFPGGLKSE